MSIRTNSTCNCHTITGGPNLSFHFLFFFYLFFFLSMISVQMDCKHFTGGICGESLASLSLKCKALFMRSIENLDV